MTLQPGSLYSILDRLTEEGSITDVGQEIVEGRLRRYYGLTDQGAGELHSEIGRLECNAKAARASLALRAEGGFA